MMRKFGVVRLVGIALAATHTVAQAADDILVTKALPAPPALAGTDWTGFDVGGHFGVAWGSSNWTAAPGISGSTNLFQRIDTFDEGGSFFEGLQAGYNYTLP